MNEEQQDKVSEIVPTVDFEYDMGFLGGESDGEAGNYSGAGAITQIPVSLIEASDEKTAFEQFTKLNRCHVVHWEPETSEAYGNEKTQRQIDQIKRRFEAGIDDHRKMCPVCSVWKIK